MDKKRFHKTRIVDKWGGIYDSKTDRVLDVNDVEHKLNEQQAKIEEQNKQIEEWEFSFRTEMAHHRVAEKELQDKMREQQATIEAKNEYQQVLEAKIRRLKNRIKILEKADGWQN